MANENNTNTTAEFIKDANTDCTLFSEHPNYETLKKAYFQNWENWAAMEIGDLTCEHICHIKSVSAGSVGAMRKKLSAYDCLNKMAGSRDNTAALTAAREAQRAAELALANQRAEMREKLIAQGLNPADFGL